MAITKITGGGITADAIDGTKIADDAINSEHLAADSIDAEHYAAGSVDATALGADAVTAAKIGDDVIDSEHYAATSVDDAHINDVAASKLTGTIATARLGSGTASSSTILYGDQTYKTEPAGFDPDAAVVFNESGADVDFRVESDDNASMFFVDGGNDRIGIGTNSPGVQVEIVDAFEPRLKLRNSVTPDGTKYGGILDLQLGSGGGGGSGNDDTQDGDKLGVINFLGQGTDYAYQGAAIMAEVQTGDGTATRTEQGVELQFHTMPTTSTGYAKRWTIDQDGDLIPASTSTGIVLGATTNVAANTLDDYEEGTWTPSWTSGGTDPTVSHSPTATYVKVGRLVTCTLTMGASASVSGGSSSNDLRISGLPFTNLSNGGTGSVPTCQNWNTDANAPVVGYVDPSQTYIALRRYTNAYEAHTTVKTSDMRTSGDSNQLRMSITYEAT